MALHDTHRTWADKWMTGGRKGDPPKVLELLNFAFAKIPVSSFPKPPFGKVVEILADSSITETVEILSKFNIFSAPVRLPDVDCKSDWTDRYLGIVDYGAVILWVLEQAELAAATLAAGSATAAGMGAGAVGALGAFALGSTGAGAVACLTVAAVGAAIAGGLALDRGIGKDAPSAADALGEDFYKIILQEEPFKSTKVADITKSYRWTPFLPVQPDDSMLTVLLLLSKFRLRSIPIVEKDNPDIKNYLTQSAVVRGLVECQGRDWFEEIARKTLGELGLPVMAPHEVIFIDANKLVLEAFTLMQEKQVGALPVIDGPERKIMGNISLRDVRFLILEQSLFAQRKALTVLEFMKTVISNSLCSVPPVMIPAVTCTVDTKLTNVIEKLSEKHIHRIYVIDDQSHVVGVVTLRDIISCFVSEPEHYFDGYFGGTLKENLSC